MSDQRVASRMRRPRAKCMIVLGETFMRHLWRRADAQGRVARAAEQQSKGEAEQPGSRAAEQPSSGERGSGCGLF